MSCTVPDSVKNLKIKVKPDVPSVMLTWDPPQNIKAEDVTRYHIHFKPQESCNTFQQLSVDGHHHEITLGKKELKPLTTYDFKVRAVSSDGEGLWTAVTECFCKDTPYSQLRSCLCQELYLGHTWSLVASQYTSVMLHHPRMSLHERVNCGANLIAKRLICTHADNAHMLTMHTC